MAGDELVFDDGFKRSANPDWNERRAASQGPRPCVDYRCLIDAKTKMTDLLALNEDMVLDAHRYSNKSMAVHHREESRITPGVCAAHHSMT